MAGEPILQYRRLDFLSFRSSDALSAKCDGLQRSPVEHVQMLLVKSATLNEYESVFCRWHPILRAQTSEHQPLLDPGESYGNVAL